METAIEQPVGIRAAARELGLNPSTVSRQVRAGIIPNRGTAAEPRVLLSEARLAREANLDRAKQRGPLAPLFAPPPAGAATVVQDAPAAKGADPSWQSARTEGATIDTQLKKLQLERELGNVLDKGEVLDAFFALAAAHREALETRRPLLAARLVNIADPNRLAQILAEEDRAALTAIADAFERRFAAVAETEAGA